MACNCHYCYVSPHVLEAAMDAIIVPFASYMVSNLAFDIIRLYPLHATFQLVATFNLDAETLGTFN